MKPAKRDTARQHKKAKQGRFLSAFAKCGSIGVAAIAAGVARTVHYRWLQSPEYAAAFVVAQDQAIERLEHEARRRAMVGVLKPIYQGGKKVGAVRQYSDVLLIFLLKAARPDVYRDRTRHEIVGAHGGPVEIAAVRSSVRQIISKPEAMQAARQLARAMQDQQQPTAGDAGQQKGRM